MPLLISTFNPSPVLRPAWVQTIAPKLCRKINGAPGEYEFLELADGDFLELEWYVPAVTSGAMPLVLLTHGLEGSTKSGYLQGLVSALVENNYPVLAWNMRGCGTQRNRLLSWYHSGQTADLASVIKRARERFPSVSIALVGVSIGGNIVCKFVGETGSMLPNSIKTAIAISPPLDLRGSAEILARPSRALYMRYLLRPLCARMREKADRFPGQIDIRGLDKIRSFHEFDTRYTVPLHGFTSLDHYWDSCSGLQFLPHATIPIYIVSACDDPFLSPHCFPTALAQRSELIHLETPPHGGHVGFIESLTGRRTWVESRVLEYLTRIFHEACYYER